MIDARKSLREKINARRKLPGAPVRRALREAAGLAQQDIADACGVHRETVSRWEAGKRTPRGQFLVRYLGVLEELTGKRKPTR